MIINDENTADMQRQSYTVTEQTISVVSKSTPRTLGSRAIAVYALGLQSDPNYNAIVSNAYESRYNTSLQSVHSIDNLGLHASITYSDGLAKAKTKHRRGQSPLGRTSFTVCL